MFNFNTFKQKSLQQRFLFFVGLVMLLFYLSLGLLLIFWSDIPFQIDKGYRIAFGILLIVYTVIRFGRLMRSSDNE